MSIIIVNADIIGLEWSTISLCSTKAKVLFQKSPLFLKCFRTHLMSLWLMMTAHLSASTSKQAFASFGTNADGVMRQESASL